VCNYDYRADTDGWVFSSAYCSSTFGTWDFVEVLMSHRAWFSGYYFDEGWIWACVNVPKQSDCG
jgi:hypothetical protein